MVVRIVRCCEEDDVIGYRLGKRAVHCEIRSEMRKGSATCRGGDEQLANTVAGIRNIRMGVRITRSDTLDIGRELSPLAVMRSTVVTLGSVRALRTLR